MDILNKHIVSKQNDYISFSSRNKLTMNKIKLNNISNTNLKMINIINNKNKKKKKQYKKYFKNKFYFNQ